MPFALPNNAPPRPRVRPAMDIVEYDDAILVLVNIPGVPASDLRVELDKSQLAIQGASQGGIPYTEAQQGKRQGSEARHTRTMEFVDVEYRLAMRLSAEIEPIGIRALLRNGVLTLFLPRRQYGRRRIAVETDT